MTSERAQNASFFPVDYEIHPSIMAGEGGLPFTLFVAATLKPFETRTFTLRRTSMSLLSRHLLAHANELQAAFRSYSHDASMQLLRTVQMPQS